MDPAHAVPFDYASVTSADVQAGIDSAIVRAESLVGEIAAVPDAERSVANTLHPVDEISDLLMQAGGRYGFLSQVSPDAALRETAHAAEEKLGHLRDRAGLSRGARRRPARARRLLPGPGDGAGGVTLPGLRPARLPSQRDVAGRGADAAACVTSRSAWCNWASPSAATSTSTRMRSSCRAPSSTACRTPTSTGWPPSSGTARPAIACRWTTPTWSPSSKTPTTAPCARSCSARTTTRPPRRTCRSWRRRSACAPRSRRSWVTPRGRTTRRRSAWPARPRSCWSS